MFSIYGIINSKKYENHCNECSCRYNCCEMKLSALKVRDESFFRLSSTHLVFGHVQESHRVSLALDICPHCVQGFVKLPLNISQLLKNLAG